MATAGLFLKGHNFGQTNYLNIDAGTISKYSSWTLFKAFEKYFLNGWQHSLKVRQFLEWVASWKVSTVKAFEMQKHVLSSVSNWKTKYVRWLITKFTVTELQLWTHALGNWTAETDDYQWNEQFGGLFPRIRLISLCPAWLNKPCLNLVRRNDRLLSILVVFTEFQSEISSQ